MKERKPIGLILLTILAGWCVVCSLLTSCQKISVRGHLSQMVGDWAEVRLPPGCAARQIAAEEGGGTVVLCEDGRVFH